MPLSEQDKKLLQRVKEDEIEYIVFERCDFYTTSIGKIVPARHLKGYLLHGIQMQKPSFSMSAKALGFYLNDTFMNTSNVCCFVDHSTYKKFPLSLCSDANMARLIYYPTYSPTDNFGKQNPQLFQVDPRSLCLEQFRKLKLEYGFDLYSAFEHEFQMFHKTEDTTELKPLWNHKDCMNNTSISEHQNFMIECERTLRSMGVNLETMHLDYGPGAYEWTMKPEWNIQSADNAFTYKSVIRKLAMKHKYVASFATTPLWDDTDGIRSCSNGAHFNHSLWNNKNNKNIFYDVDSKDGISVFAKYWIGGIMHHMKAITAFSVPTVNCYRRIRAHAWCPNTTSWGFGNRLTMIRVRRDGKRGTFLEFRLPSVACNPYLVIASVLMAGMDGIKNQIMPQFGPTSVDPNGSDDENQLKYKKVPECLEDALEELMKDEVICNGFGKQFIETYVGVKRIEIDTLAELAKSFGGDEAKAEKHIFSKL